MKEIVVVTDCIRNRCQGRFHGWKGRVSYPSGKSEETAIGVGVPVVGDEVALRVVIVVHPRLAGVELGWWDPFSAAIFAFSGAPTACFDAAVVGAAGQGVIGGVGLTALDPIGDGVVDLAVTGRRRTAGKCAASHLGMKAARAEESATGKPMVGT